MLDTHWLWAVFTLLAAADQPRATAPSGRRTSALFGFPFALVLLAGVVTVTGDALPRSPLVFWPWGVGIVLVVIGVALLIPGR